MRAEVLALKQVVSREARADLKRLRAAARHLSVLVPDAETVLLVCGVGLLTIGVGGFDWRVAKIVLGGLFLGVLVARRRRWIGGPR